MVSNIKIKRILFCIIGLIFMLSSAFSYVYASETKTEKEDMIQESETISIESVFIESVFETYESELETETYESNPETEEVETKDTEVLETVNSEENVAESEADELKELTEDAIKQVLGYYHFILTYDDLMRLEKEGYDISRFSEATVFEEMASIPMLRSLPVEHDVTHVGQASVSYSKLDADKLYLFGSNSYYKNGAYTRIYGTKKRITIGSKVYIGFCFEPSGTDPMADTLLDCYRLNNRPDIVKALYYGYGGPEFETGGFKTLLDNIGSDNSYFYSGGRENCYEVLTHCLIGKLYGDSAWAMGLSQESADAVVTMEDMLKKLPGPVDPVISLQRHDGKSIQNEETYIENGYQRTTTLKVTGDSRNNLQLKLPKGVEAVDGGAKVYSGTFSLAGGTYFYLRANINYSGVYDSGNIKGAYSTSYVPYMIFGGEGTKQDCGTLFSESYSATTSMSVVFKATTGNLVLTKISSDSKIINDEVNYSLSGAKYGVYSNSSCTQSVGLLTTTSSGLTNTLSLSEGIYYVKEIEASKGYHLDTNVYKVVVNSGKKTELKVKEDPVLGKICLTKVIHANDINFDNGNPMFMFKLTYTDSQNNVRTWYEIVDFTKSYVDTHTDESGDVSLTVEFDELIAGTYKAYELETSRYTLESITHLKNGVKMNDTVKFTLSTSDQMEGKARFTNDNYEQQNFSDSAKVINVLIK